MSLADSLLLDPYSFEVWVAVRTDGMNGCGTLNDPYGVSTETQFDSLMNSLPANARVHLGPGLFKTQGYVVGASSSWAKAGMKISGAGMDATTLQVVNAGTSNSTMFAIGHPLILGVQPNLLDYFELSNLTIDCNLTSGTGANASCGGVRVMGNHLRLQRVKVINWGTKTTSKPCFGLGIVAADPSISVPATIDPGIVECIVVQPSGSNIGPATAIHIGRKDDVATNAEGFAQGPVIRHCFVDCGWPTATGESRGLSMEWCRGGIVEGNQVHFTQYGGPHVEKASIREMVVRDNFYKNVAKGPYWKLGGLGATSLGAGTISRAGTLGTVAITNHGLALGDRVKLVTNNGSFDGVYVVVTVNGNNFTVTVPDSGPSSEPVSSAYRVFGVNNLLVEGNTMELAKGADGIVAIHLDDNLLSPATPDYVNGDVIVRGNHVHYLDSQFATGWSGYGIQMNGAKNVIIRDNILESAPANPLRNQRCGAVKYFNNQTPSGTLVEGFNPDTVQRYAELETDNDFALIMSLFNRKAR